MKRTRLAQTVVKVFLGFIRYTDIVDQNGFHLNDLLINTRRLTPYNMVFWQEVSPLA